MARLSLQAATLDEGLTHWGPDKMAAISQTTFSDAFPWMKMYELRLRFHWILFPGVQLTIFHRWFWLGANQVTSHYMNQWWLISLLTHICVTLSQSVKAGHMVGWGGGQIHCWLIGTGHGQSQKKNGHQVDCLGHHWERWSLPSASPVTSRAVILTILRFQWWWSIDHLWYGVFSGWNLSG